MTAAKAPATNHYDPAQSAYVWKKPAPVKQWFTSDLHLGHQTAANLRGFTAADKWTVADHDDTIAERWIDAGIKGNDIVWVLGDLTGSDSQWVVDKALDVMRGLPGRKRLILGNHDPAHPKNKDAHRWMGAYQGVFELVAPFAETKIGTKDVVLSHFPYDRDRKADKIRYLQWRLRDEGAVLLCGHTHGTEKVAVRDDGTLREIHVGVDAWNLEPVPDHTIQYLLDDWTRADDDTVLHPGEMALGIVDLPKPDYGTYGGSWSAYKGERWDPDTKTWVKIDNSDPEAPAVLGNYKTTGPHKVNPLDLAPGDLADPPPPLPGPYGDDWPYSAEESAKAWTQPEADDGPVDDFAGMTDEEINSLTDEQWEALLAKWDKEDPDWRTTNVATTYKAPDPIGYDEIGSADEEWKGCIEAIDTLKEALAVGQAAPRPENLDPDLYPEWREPVTPPAPLIAVAPRPADPEPESAEDATCGTCGFTMAHHDSVEAKAAHDKAEAEQDATTKRARVRGPGKAVAKRDGHRDGCTCVQCVIGPTFPVGVARSEGWEAP